MIRYVMAFVALVGAHLFAAAPANAWVEEAIAAAKAQRGEGVSSERASRRTRAASNDDASERRSASRRAAQQASRDDDDGSRPQRRSAARQQPRESLSGGGETGIASYYWQPQRVASGGWFNPDAWTAAHKTLPFGTRVRVTHLGNGNSVEVTINDRGPYVAGRIIDLSRRAAQAIGMTGQGIAQVRVTVLGRG